MASTRVSLMAAVAAAAVMLVVTSSNACWKGCLTRAECLFNFRNDSTEQKLCVLVGLLLFDDAARFVMQRFSGSFLLYAQCSPDRFLPD